MSPQTEFEAWVRSELAFIAGPVEPLPDPYGRLLRRRRFGWLRRGLAGGVAILAAATGTVVALSPGEPPPPPDNTLAWVDALVDGPPRGAVAADPDFRFDLEYRLTQIVRNGTSHDALRAVDDAFHPEQSVRLVFADDIEDRRIAVLALRLPSAPSPELGRTHLVWVSGPRGANPDWLESGFELGVFPGVEVGTVFRHAAPLSIVQAGFPPTETTWLGLAPPGCVVSSAPATHPDDWRPEPTGSYIVRTMATFRPERWRVTCGGQLREERVPPWSEQLPADPDETLDLAIADLTTAGLDAAAALYTASFAYDSVVVFNRPYLAGPLRLLYVGHPAGLVGEPASATVEAAVLVAPTVYSTWIAFLSVTYGEGDQKAGSGAIVRLDSDPFAPGATLAAQVSSGPVSQVLALLPPPAATAELLAADGTRMATANVADGTAVFQLGVDVVGVDLTVVAYDEAGNRLSTTPLALRPPLFDETVDWD